MKVNDIKSELFALQELIESDNFDVDQETGEVFDNSKLLQDLLDEVELAKEDKADNIIYLIKEAKVAEDYLQSEIKRLTERKAMMKRKQDSLKDLLDYLLEGEKLKTSKHTIFYKNTTSVDIVDETKIPPKYITVKEVFGIDKKAIKEDLFNFENVEGATLKVKKGVQFR